MNRLKVVALVVLVSLVTLKMPYPVLAVLMLWSVVCMFLLPRAKRRPVKIALANLGMVFLILAALECLLWIHPNLFKPSAPEGHTEGSYTNLEFYFRQNVPVLGYAAYPSVQATSRKMHGGRILYDVIYSMNSHGLRITPPARIPGARGVLFFGCSFTLGEGVRDEEAMPYQVGLMAGDGFQVYNFGFHGYGPHQMLAALEYGFVDSVATVTPKYVIYQALPEHVGRAAGLSSWDRHGPRYQLTPEGSVVYTGPFDASLWTPGPVEAYVRWQAQKSSIGRLILAWPRSPTRQDVARFVAIVTQTKRLTETRWPGSEFHVLFWSDGTRMSRRIERELREQGVRVHEIVEAIPGIDRMPSRYRIPIDGHPTELAHREIARYVTERILHAPPARAAQGPGIDSRAEH